MNLLADRTTQRKRARGKFNGRTIFSCIDLFCVRTKYSVSVCLVSTVYYDKTIKKKTGMLFGADVFSNMGGHTHRKGGFRISD